MNENNFINEQIKKEKIDTKELLRDLIILIKDNIVAKISAYGQEISLTFINGQKFILTLYEVQT